MKKIYITFCIIGILLLASCSDHLKSDYLFQDRMSLEDVFTSRDYSDRWLAHAYSFLRIGEMADISSKGKMPFAFADDMYFGDRDDLYKRWKNGDYQEENAMYSVGFYVWDSGYKGIRQASVYIENIDMNTMMTAEQIKEGKAEAHFLRGMFYWKMLRLFGPIPILPNEGLDYTEDYEKLYKPRNSYDECVDFIENELLLAAEGLPLTQSSNHIARPTKGAALALRARLLLHAASPLINGGGDYSSVTAEIKDDTGRALMPATNDNSKWAKAAAAARDVMELGRYDLYHTPKVINGSPGRPTTITPPNDGDFSEKGWPEGWADIDPQLSYADVFNGTVPSSTSSELIFTRGTNQIAEKAAAEDIVEMVLHQLPHTAGGYNTHGITLKMSDAYYMADGSDLPGKDKEIGKGNGSNRASGYVTEQDVQDGKFRPLSKGVSLQFANREPRFYASVAYNGAVWPMLNETKEEHRNRQVFYYRGTNDGYTNTIYWLRTGLGVMKYVHPSDTFEEGKREKVVYKYETNIRYAEILLIYAEAINELDGAYSIPSWDKSMTYSLTRDIAEMKKGIRPIRCRAGVIDYSSTEYADQGLFRAKLKRERQIEFMGEGHRYFDLRRWLDAPVEESSPIHGYNYLATKDQPEMFHTPIVIPSLPTTFSKKMWFWPITHTELKRNKKLTQNPGWTYPY